MNVDRRECLKTSLALVAPAMLVLGAVLPSVLILPIVLTLFLGTIVAAYWLDPTDVIQLKFRPGATVFSIIVIFLSWIDAVIKLAE